MAWKESGQNAKMELSSNDTKNTNPSMNPSIIINNEQIMNSLAQARLILNNFKSNPKLNEGCRIVVVDLIINYLIQNYIRLNVQLVKKIAEDIIDVFPIAPLQTIWKETSRKALR